MNKKIEAAVLLKLWVTKNTNKKSTYTLKKTTTVETDTFYVTENSILFSCSVLFSDAS